jgi:ABC-type amino acid transport substrate-binding protein
MFGAWLAAAIASAAAPNVPPVRFCLPAHNLPFSSSHEPWGIDAEVVKKIGLEIGRDTVIVWLMDAEESPDEALRKGRCDAATGAIVEAHGLAQQRNTTGLSLTDPYYLAGYALVQRPSAFSPARLEQIGEERIAVEMVSIPIYTLKQRGLKVYALDDMDAVIQAVADGRATYGYVWGPMATWLLRDREDVVLASSYAPEETWGFAIATRFADSGLRNSIDGALTHLTSSGWIEQIFEKYGIVYLESKVGAASN